MQSECGELSRPGLGACRPGGLEGAAPCAAAESLPTAVAAAHCSRHVLLYCRRRFWDLATGQCVRKAEGHADAVRVLTAVAPAEAGQRGDVVSGAYDGAVGVW